jgi:hypothetical protein
MSDNTPELLRVCCLPVDGAAAHEVVRGSVAEVCAKCDAGVWLAPSSLAAIRDHAGPAVALCIDCFMVEWRRCPGEVQAPTAAQRAELFDHQHRN